MKMGIDNSRFRSPLPFILAFGIIGSITLYLFMTYRNENLVLKDKLEYYVYKSTSQGQALTKTKNSLDTCIAQEQSFQQGIQNLQVQVKDNEKEIGTLKADIDACNFRRDLGNKFYTNVKQILGKVEALEELEQGQSRIPDEAYDLLKEEIQKLKEKSERLITLQEEKSILEEKLSNVEQSREKLETQMKDYQSQFEELTEKNRKLSTQISTIETEVAKNKARGFQVKQISIEPNVQKVILNDAAATENGAPSGQLESEKKETVQASDGNMVQVATPDAVSNVPDEASNGISNPLEAESVKDEGEKPLSESSTPGSTPEEKVTEVSSEISTPVNTTEADSSENTEETNKISDDTKELIAGEKEEKKVDGTETAAV